MRLHRLPGCSAGRLAGLTTVTLLAACGAPRSSPTVTADNARFEFLTASLVPMEYAPSGVASGGTGPRGGAFSR